MENSPLTPLPLERGGAGGEVPHQPSPALSTEERLLAALAHAGALMYGIGIILPLIVWVTQRRKSVYARFQALQALAYQTSQTVVVMLLSLLAYPVMMVLFFALAGSTGEFLDSPYGIITFEFLLMGFLLGGMGIYVLVGLAGAVICLTGRNFKYPILGGWLARYLSPAPVELRGEVMP